MSHTTIRRNAHKKIDGLVACALRARLLDHSDMGSDRAMADPTDAAEELAAWKKWTVDRGRSTTCGASIHERTNVNGERETVLWLSWHMNRLLEYVLDPSLVKVA